MITVEEFKNGMFRFKIDDMDCLNYPIYAKLVSCPSTLKLEDEYIGTLPDWLYNNLVKLPSIERMSDNVVLDLLKKLAIDRYPSDTELSECKYDIPNYYEYVSSQNLFKYVFHSILSNDLAILKIPGLNVLVRLDDGRITMYSTFNFFGKHQMSKWFLELFNKYLNILNYE